MQRSHRIASAYVVCALAMSAAAGTIRVPDDAATIQDAVDAAAPGDLVLVRGGRHTENLVLDGVRGVTVKGIRATLDGGAGPVIRVVDCEDVTIQGFAVTGGDGDAVTVTDSTGIELSKLKIEGHAERGVVVRGADDTTILRCRIEGGIGHGVDVAASDGVTVDRCQLLGVAGDAILLGDPFDDDGACNDGSVLRNRIFRPGDDGIRVAGSGNAVEDNRIQEPGGVGIVLEDAFAATGNRCVRNQLKKVGSVGLYIGGSACLVERNAVNQTGDLGLSLAGAGQHLAESNSIKKSAEEGIEVQPGAVLCELIRNRVSRSGDDGIDVKAGPTRVLSNRVVGAGDDGIDINRADGCTIENNVVTKSDDYGFQIESAGNTIRFNKSKDSGSFDLTDRAGFGANTYEKNRFPKIDPDGNPFVEGD